LSLPEKPASTPAETYRTQRRKRFRVRYQDGMVELGLGMILVLETLLNESEHFSFTSQVTSLLVLVQPLLSLLLLTAGIFGIGYFRHRLLSSRNGPKEIPLAPPILFASLLLMLLLLIAPLVWPLQAYSAQIYTWVFCTLGLVLSSVFLGLGIENRLQRFWMLGLWCGVITLVFTFVGQPGLLANRLAILLGISAGLLASGGCALLRYLRYTQALPSRKILKENIKLKDY
jgi:hypothetical protein